jgi:guanylate kinase
MRNPHLFVLVGASGSGKDPLIRAVDEMGVQHAQIIPKHTTRKRREDDGSEMFCPGDHDYDIEGCDIVYENYGDQYGIKSYQIWKGLQTGKNQVIVVSNTNAIRNLRKMFGDLMVLVYVYSSTSASEYRREVIKYGEDSYAEKRVEEYLLALDVYLRHFRAFNHVLINVGLYEDLYDQLFRLFRAYERGDLAYVGARPVASGLILED